MNGEGNHVRALGLLLEEAKKLIGDMKVEIVRNSGAIASVIAHALYPRNTTIARAPLLRQPSRDAAPTALQCLTRTRNSKLY